MGICLWIVDNNSVGGSQRFEKKISVREEEVGIWGQKLGTNICNYTCKGNPYAFIMANRHICGIWADMRPGLLY